MEVFRIIKRIIPFIFVTLFLISLGAGFANEKPEFRAMWVSSYGYGADVCTPERIDELVAHAKVANLNALVVQVRKTGDAFYNSDYDPRAEDLLLPDFDPLAYLIERGHAEGIEVHAWLNTYKVWMGRTPPKSPDHVVNKHPEWLNKTNTGETAKSGNYGLDPGIREAQEFTYNVYMDVVRKYDVDGVHFDYVRYWDPTYGYSDLAVARFNKETGRKGIPKVDDPVWCQWRRDRVTDLVRQVYEGVRATKPWVKVTASVVANHPRGPLPKDFTKSHPYNMLLQDWERWTREGIIDAVLPMNYKRERIPEQAKAFRDWIDGMVRWRHDRHAYNGISVGRDWSRRLAGHDTDSLVAQIEASRKGGTDGICGFAFNRSGARRNLAFALRQRVFRTWVPTPPMPWLPPRTSGGPVMPPEPKDGIDRFMYYSGLENTITYLKQVIEKSPDSAEAHYRLGRCYRLKGMKSEAVAEFNEVLRINPTHGGALVEVRRIEGKD